MKKITIFCVCAMLACRISAQVYPTSFNWFTNPLKEDQVVQGPCNTFAAVALAESWFYIQYAQTIRLSQQHTYSSCLVNGSPFTTITQSLDFLKATGIGTNSDISWGDPRFSLCLQNCQGDPYFAATSTWPAGFTCFDPFSITELYKVGGYRQIDMTTLYPSVTPTMDKLKRALLNYGPIALNMVTSAASSAHLHDQSTHHAYLIYGWGSQGWLLRDSWPASQSPGATSYYNGDLIADILNGSTQVFDPNGKMGTVLIPGTSNNAAFGIKSPNWTVDGTESQIVGVPITTTLNFSPTITLTSHSTYVSSSSPASVSVNLASLTPELDAGYTTQWFSAPPTGSVIAGKAFFGTPAATTSTFSCSTEGWVQIGIRIIRANGLAESYVKPGNVYVCPGIPVRFRENYDFCSGTTRFVQWELIGDSTFTPPNTLRVTWNPQMPTGLSYSLNYTTDYFLNSILTIDILNLTTPTGYALRPVITDNSYPGLSSQMTQGASESACGTGHAVINPDGSATVQTDEDAAIHSIHIFPNPATNTVHVQLPGFAHYNIRMLDISGGEMWKGSANTSLDIDVSRYARGMYIIEVLSGQGDKKPTIQKVILQ